MFLFEKISLFWDRLTAFLFKGLMAALLLCTLLSAGNAFVRKLTGYSSNSFLELQWMLFSSVFMLGGCYLLQQDGHIRIDLLYQKCSQKTQYLINFMCHICFSLPFFILLTVYSVPFWMDSFMPTVADHDFWYYLFVDHSYFEQSANAGGLPTPLVKMLIPLGFLLLSVQTISELIKYAIKLEWLPIQSDFSDDISDLVAIKRT